MQVNVTYQRETLAGAENRVSTGPIDADADEQLEEEHSELLGSGPTPGSNDLSNSGTPDIDNTIRNPLLNPEFISRNLVMKRLLSIQDLIKS